MKCSSLLSYARQSIGSSNILPPIPLYRRVLRANRKLPPKQRLLGDKYVKAEFKLHKNTVNPIHIIGFLTSWQKYAEAIEGDHWREEKLNIGKIERLSDDQKIQLYELMQAAQGKKSEYGIHENKSKDLDEKGNN